MKSRTWQLSLSASVAIVAYLLAACGGGDAGIRATASPMPAGEATAPAAINTPSGPLTLRLGYFPNITHAPALIGVRDGIFANELGPNVKLESKTFNAGPAVIEALFAGEIDISYIGPNPAINGFVQSDGKALRIIAGAASGGASLIIRTDRNINAPEDFANKKIATPQLGNTQDVALRTWLADHGLKAKEKGGNVTILPTENATTLTLFQKGDIDAAWVPEPWATRLLQAGGKVFLDERTLWPDGKFVTTNVIVRSAFLEKNPEAVEAFLLGHVKAVQAIIADPEKSKATANAAIKGITNAALAGDVIDAAWMNLEFTFDPLPATLRASAESAYDLGFLGTKRLDLTNIYALAPLNRVLAFLKISTIKDQ